MIGARPALVLLLTASLAVPLLVWGVGLRRELEFPLFAGLHLLATAAWITLVYAVLRGAWRPGFRELFAVALFLRLCAFALPPALSDDVYRYLHEGNVVAHGVNPYRHAPSSPEVAAFRGAYAERINNRDIPAAYPPAVQGVLAIGALLQPGAQEQEQPFPWALKLLFGACDLLVFVVLWRLLPHWGRPRTLALVHGACPLVALEFVGEAHSDSLAVLALLVALWALACHRGRVAGGLLAVATAAKFLPAVLLPYFLRVDRRVLVAFAVVVAAAWLPFLAPPAEMFAGLFQYSVRWRHNDSAFAVLTWGMEALFGNRDGTFMAWPLAGLEIQMVTKVPLVLAAGALLAWCWRQHLRVEQVACAFFLLFLAAAPTVHPWYVGLAVPFLCLVPRLGLLAFTGTVYLSYNLLPAFRVALERGHPDPGTSWVEDPLLKVLEYAPFYLGLISLCILRRNRAIERSCSSPTSS